MMQMMGNTFAGIATRITSIHQPQQSFASLMQDQIHLLCRGQNFYQGPNQGKKMQVYVYKITARPHLQISYVGIIDEPETNNFHYTNLS